MTSTPNPSSPHAESPRSASNTGGTPGPPKPAAEAWTVRRLLGWISDALTRNEIDSPRLCAELLLTHVLSCERLRLYTDPDRELDPSTLATLRGLVGRALKHEPIQYLTGEAMFFGLAFAVDRRVLIPRPSTETIVEEVLQDQRRRRQREMPVVGEGVQDAADGVPRTPIVAEPALLIADVCTGSGCIGIALAKRLPSARVIATDISPEAIECATFNAARHRVAERVEFRPGHLLEPLAAEAGSIDILVSNPPYVPDHEWDAVEPNVRDFEPHGALRGGAGGLDLVHPIIDGAPLLLRAGGVLLIEVAACTAAACAERARAAGLSDVRVLKDIDGLDRVIVGRRL